MVFPFTDTPLAPDLLSVSQGDIRNNIDYLQATLNKDHQTVFGDTNVTVFEGRHKQVSMNDRANNNLAIPADGTDNFLWGSGGNLFWRNTTVANGVQMTVNIDPLAAASGYTFLPGGLLLQWGINAGVAAATTINFPVPFVAAFQVIPALSNFDRTFGITALLPTQFTITANASLVGYNIRWFAIGTK